MHVLASSTLTMNHSQKHLGWKPNFMTQSLILFKPILSTLSTPNCLHLPAHPSVSHAIRQWVQSSDRVSARSLAIEMNPTIIIKHKS